MSAADYLAALARAGSWSVPPDSVVPGARPRPRSRYEPGPGEPAEFETAEDEIPLPAQAPSATVPSVTSHHGQWGAHPQPTPNDRPSAPPAAAAESRRASVPTPVHAPSAPVPVRAAAPRPAIGVPEVRPATPQILARAEQVDRQGPPQAPPPSGQPTLSPSTVLDDVPPHELRDRELAATAAPAPVGAPRHDEQVALPAARPREHAQDDLDRSEPPLAPLSEQDDAIDDPPVIVVEIGRIEVRLAPDPPAGRASAPPASRPDPPGPSLAAYLRDREPTNAGHS
ncbi:hypothetical protein ACFCVO_00245 [Agromyces sp. NPDC056379]|uniref:hypothetical protein n=1 Tax=unclassified Agromyces TaxID=2639701 RepID=UPI0035D8F767